MINKEKPMTKKTFKGRPLLPGKLEGKALASKQPLNTTGSYLENLFSGNSKTAPCTDPNNKEFYKKELSGAIICTTTTVGSSLGGAALMGVASLGLGPKAMLFSQHVDSVSIAGLLMDDIWNGKRIITIDLLGDEFLEAVKSGDTVSIKEDGTVEVG
jgi:predicted aconitase with swiveling domain